MISVVWFKRDLRLDDHSPLIKALNMDHPTLCLHIIEPDLWKEPDLSFRQYQFYKESIQDLLTQFESKGLHLVLKVGQALDVLKELHNTYGLHSIYSHQETWNNWTYQRDIVIKKWTKENAIIWDESLQFAVFRRLSTRDGWSKKWNMLMNQEPFKAPKNKTSLNLKNDPIPTDKKVGLSDDGCCYRQKGGRKEALSLLNSFFDHRGCHYTKDMSSPISAKDACSRLSPYLAFGCISMREVHHYTRNFQGKGAFQDRENQKQWRSAVRSFSGRLRWHCHFIQKLEDQPSLEFKNQHPAYDSVLYNDTKNSDSFDRWKKGETGYPFVDACMRALTTWGWINFRMRAMLMSFVSHHLFHHWRDSAVYLATQFVDYEPGIHYSQCQMQAGTTGINAIRIYNPIKQGKDQDPEGVFIREWIPELRECPKEFIHEPWHWVSERNLYPLPIVDEKEARTAASKQLYSLRRHKDFKDEAKKIVNKHASRKKNAPLKKRDQLQLFE